MPKRVRTRINEGFWEEPQKVALQLFGKVMVLGDVEATIRRAQGYGREDGLRGLYEPMLEMEPGRIYCPSLGRSVLLVIAVLDQSKKGGRVLIREVDIAGCMFKGPGRVTERLLIKAKATGRITWLDANTFRVDMD